MILEILVMKKLWFFKETKKNIKYPLFYMQPFYEQHQTALAKN